MSIQNIAILKQGDTPQSYSANPGILTGPWGDTYYEAITIYEAETGFEVIKHWEINGNLWITTNEKEC